MTDVRDELIELRGLRFHYRDWPSSKPGAKDLVLLHGYTGHARSWDAFAAAMSDTYRVLALDQRGHGETQWAPPQAYGTREMVTDLEAFVAAMGLSDFTLLGLSMGGIVAIGYAGVRPPELSRLVIVDIAPEIAAEGYQKILTNVARSDTFATREEAFARARQDNSIPPEDHHRHRVYNSLMRTEEGLWTYRYDRALRDASIPREPITAEEGWKYVQNFNVPTLLIRGELSDILSPDIAERMAKEIPDCELQEIPGSGHPVPLDKPEPFLEVARTFLTG
ncbi:MAG: alpha/beta hydrolase [Gammaproteobacteria bacterium]|nr:alpha/beta hydrolase [Gammaproteobacteria bacterium]